MTIKQKGLGIFLFTLALLTSIFVARDKKTVLYDEYDRLMV